jgi:hypothetical protein
MGVTPGRVSQIERGELATIDAVARYVQALGGRLDLIATLGDHTSPSPQPKRHDQICRPVPRLVGVSHAAHPEADPIPSSARHTAHPLPNPLQRRDRLGLPTWAYSLPLEQRRPEQAAHRQLVGQLMELITERTHNHQLSLTASPATVKMAVPAS